MSVSFTSYEQLPSIMLPTNGSYVSEEIELLRCSREHLSVVYDQSKWIWAVDITLCVFASITAITATIGNALVILAVWQTPTLRNPSNIILFFLAITDLLTGLITQPTFVLHLILQMNQSVKAYCIVAEFMAAVGFMLSGTSFSVLTIVGIDKYFAVRYHLRYNVIVTNARIFQTMSIILILNACILTVFYFNYRVYTILILFLVCINLLGWFLCYSFVFRHVEKHKRELGRLAVEMARIQSHAGPIQHLRKLEYSTYTAIFIVGLYFVCYIPFLVVSIVKSSLGYHSSHLEVARRVASITVLLNASLNPVLYCLRLKLMRKAIKRICLRLVK